MRFLKKSRKLNISSTFKKRSFNSDTTVFNSLNLFVSKPTAEVHLPGASESTIEKRSLFDTQSFQATGQYSICHIVTTSWSHAQPKLTLFVAKAMVNLKSLYKEVVGKRRETQGWTSRSPLWANFNLFASLLIFLGISLKAVKTATDFVSYGADRIAQERVLQRLILP